MLFRTFDHAICQKDNKYYFSCSQVLKMDQNLVCWLLGFESQQNPAVQAAMFVYFSLQMPSLVSSPRGMKKANCTVYCEILNLRKRTYVPLFKLVLKMKVPNDRTILVVTTHFRKLQIMTGKRLNVTRQCPIVFGQINHFEKSV